MKQKIFIFVIFTISFYTNAQVKTTIFPEGNGFNEFPMLNQVYLENIPIYEMPSFNLDSIIQEEAELDEKGVGRPFRFGYAFDVDYGIEHGKWDTVEDKNIWSIRFKSKDAYSLNFKLSDLKLDNKSELYIYNSEGTIVYGPVTYKENSTKEFNSIGTDLIAGEEAIIQIIEHKTSTKTSTTRIMMVVHGFENLYRDILLYKNKDKNNFQSLHCHNNIMCYPTFDNVSRGVARVMVGNISICSGALLNNKAGTDRPFILTAKHCVGSCNKTLSNLDKNYIEDWNFQFNYKRNCNNNNSLVSYVSVNYSGCHFRSAWWETDFLLIELKDAIKDSNIRFLGWDVSGAEPYQPVGIHYPKGETMKISFDDHLVYSNYAAFSMSSCSNIIYPKYSHWDVWFDNGSTEGGSSGSPLFEIYSPNGDEYRVIGQLTGDSSKCPLNTRSLYGRLTESWFGGNTDDTRLSVWLHSFNTWPYTLQTNTTGLCQSFNLWNEIINRDERIICKNINVKDVTVNSGKKLILESVGGTITIGSNVTAQTGATLEIRGTISISDLSNFKLMEGAVFIVK